MHRLVIVMAVAVFGLACSGDSGTNVPPTPVLHPVDALISEWLDQNWENFAVSLIVEGTSRDLGISLEARAEYVAEEVHSALVINYGERSRINPGGDVYRVPLLLSFSALLDDLVPRVEVTFSGELPFSVLVDVGDRSVESEVDFEVAELCMKVGGPLGLEKETCTTGSDDSN